jgi:hypothetical protein
MKNSTGKFISKLIAAIPAFAFFRKEPIEKTNKSHSVHEGHITEQDNLNRIFMVRHRIQHL